MKKPVRHNKPKDLPGELADILEVNRALATAIGISGLSFLRLPREAHSARWL
jgi:hypothetical protein